MTTEEIKQMQDTFKAFTEADGKRESEVKKFGTSLGETNAKLETIHGKFDSLEKAINTRMDSEEQGKQFKALRDRIDEVEALLRKKTSAGGGADPLSEEEQNKLNRKAAFQKAMRYNSQSGKSLEQHMGPELMKALLVSNDTTGGFLAPPEYVTEILMTVVEWSQVRPLCRQRNTVRPSVQIPKRTQTAAAAWVSETGTRSETTNPAFGLVEIKCHELYAMAKVSKLDLEDSEFNLEQFLNAEFAEQFGLAEGTAFVAGNGVAQPEGLLTNANISYTASGVAADISADGLIAIYHDLKEPYLPNSSWVLSRATLKSIRQLKDGVGNYLWAPGIRSDARPAAILDRPYTTAPDMPSPASNTYPVLFGDFKRGYLIVDRLVMEMMQDPFTSKASGMIEFSARRRVGGQVIIAEAIRKLKCAVS